MKKWLITSTNHYSKLRPSASSHQGVTSGEKDHWVFFLLLLFWPKFVDVLPKWQKVSFLSCQDESEDKTRDKSLRRLCPSFKTQMTLYCPRHIFVFLDTWKSLEFIHWTSALVCDCCAQTSQCLLFCSSLQTVAGAPSVVTAAEVIISLTCYCAGSVIGWSLIHFSTKKKENCICCCCHFIRKTQRNSSREMRTARQ